MTPVTLREVRPEDLPVFFEQQRDPDAVRMAEFFSRDRETFDAHWVKVLANPTNLVRTIEFEGQVAGNIGSWEIEGQRYVGYWLGKSFWGKGIATEALAQYLKVDTQPLEGRVAKSNVGSIRVLEKCGFKNVGEDTLAVKPGMPPGEEWIYQRPGSSNELSE